MTHFIAAPRLLALAITATFVGPVLAQTPPDAGQLLQEQNVPPSMPSASPDFRIDAPLPGDTPPGGARVEVQGVTLYGYTVFDEATLQAVLGDVEGQSFDLADLRTLASRITLFYRNNGYPFARAFLPAQAASDGIIRIEILEGRFGEVTVQGDEQVVAKAKHFLAPMQPGDVINAYLLERTTLILNDQPGINIYPVMRPGESIGSGDLDVRVSREPMISGDIGLDNHGNRYTGYHRARLNLQASTPMVFGDQFTLRALYTDEGMWFGNLDYSLPLGGLGLRAKVGYSHTDYELAREFKDNGYGNAKVGSAGISYPLFRSQRLNLQLSASFQHKALYNDTNNGNAVDDYSSQSLPIALQFDRRDNVGGGGISFGNLTLSHGQLHYSDQMRQRGDMFEDRHGSFNKLQLDVIRVQTLPVTGLSLYARIAGQWTDSNLDSSENFSIAGANGVRAYPTGEASGNEGHLAQLELRYQYGAIAPYLFYDAASANANRNTIGEGGNVRSRLHGGGLGMRYQQQGLHLDVAAAWRGSDKAATPHDDDDVRLWASAGYRF